MSALKRPEMKLADTKVSDEDIARFSLGLRDADFMLPSEMDDYTHDARAVRLVADVRAGKDLSGRDFSGVNLRGADISGARLAGADFSKAVFYKTTADNCDLRDADFTDAALEDASFAGSDLRGARFRRTFAKGLRTKGAQLDESARRYLTAVEVLVAGIESGAIDLRGVPRQDLLHLDLRLLDLSQVDLSGIDLSPFILEGVNLRGAYINPKHLLSLAQLQRTQYRAAKLSEKKLKEETLRAVKGKEKELAAYAREEAEKPLPPVRTKNPKRPPVKQDEFAAAKPALKSFAMKPAADIPEDALADASDNPQHKLAAQSRKQSLKRKAKLRN
ncbi:MAG: pentapeptide repeat-containing protein [Alphaproteobacteria bacterium]|nr:pentapeptide repeat-containing protein [Alphaproteobacteria bacterium]